MDLSEAEIQVLIALIELSSPIETPNNHSYAFFPKDLEQASKYFGEFLVDWSPAYSSLRRKGFIAQVGQKDFLTESGDALAAQLRKERPPIWYWYKSYYVRTHQSQAHARFCEQVFGMNLCQDGFSDIKQIDRLIEIAGISAHHRILDLGCGNGMISEYLSDRTGAVVHGIDYIPDAIEQAERRTERKRDRLSFRVGNLDHLDFPEGYFDLVVSIDSMYMPTDLSSTVCQVKRLLRATGEIAVFFTYFAQGGQVAPSAQSETELTRAFVANQLDYRVFDFSRENYELMQRKHRVAESLREEYERERNGVLYETVHQQSIHNSEPYDPDGSWVTRYLYLVGRENGPEGG